MEVWVPETPSTLTNKGYLEGLHPSKPPLSDSPVYRRSRQSGRQYSIWVLQTQCSPVVSTAFRKSGAPEAKPLAISNFWRLSCAAQWAPGLPELRQKLFLEGMSQGVRSHTILPTYEYAHM